VRRADGRPDRLTDRHPPTTKRPGATTPGRACSRIRTRIVDRPTRIRHRGPTRRPRRVAERPRVCMAPASGLRAGEGAEPHRHPPSPGRLSPRDRAACGPVSAIRTSDLRAGPEGALTSASRISSHLARLRSTAGRLSRMPRWHVSRTSGRTQRRPCAGFAPASLFIPGQGTVGKPSRGCPSMRSPPLLLLRGRSAPEGPARSAKLAAGFSRLHGDLVDPVRFPEQLDGS